MQQNMNDINKIVLHHSASPRAATTAAQIKGWHLERGFDDIGYHLIVEGDGKVAYGRPLDVVPAAQKGANTNTVAICLVGDNTRVGEGEGWTGAQVLTANSLIVMLRTILGKRLPFVGHRDVASSECPGLEVRDVFPDLL